MYELIRVGKERLIGEIIRLENDSATIQVNYLFWACFSSTAANGVEEKPSSDLYPEVLLFAH